MSNAKHNVAAFLMVLQRALMWSIIPAALLVQIASPAFAQKRPSPQRATAQTSTRMFVFNLTPARQYEVQKNGTPTGNVTASPSGSVVVVQSTNTGDIISLIPGDVTPVDPSTPVGLQATGDDQGCVDLSWTEPNPQEYVSNYRLLWGTTQGVYTDSAMVESFQITHSAGTWNHLHCGFMTGTYYFALRAHNQFDLWSGLSSPAAATITTGNAQGPVPPTGVDASESTFGCAQVSWNPVSDVSVTGYRVYWRVKGAGSFQDSVDVSGVVSTEVCALSQGTWEFAVKSVTGGGLTSAYSAIAEAYLQGVDLEAPVLSGYSPANGATNVARNSAVVFMVTDMKSGVNLSSISVDVNGSPATFSTLGSGASYIVQASAGMLPADTDILVEVSVADNATPPNTVQDSWTFRTGTGIVTDTQPPVITAVSPTDGASGVGSSDPVIFTVSDEGLGVNLASVAVYVNNVPVAVLVEGNHMSATFRYETPTPYLPGSTVTVRVDACDLADPTNCAVTYEYSFEVQQDLFAGLADGTIVPDGFWAGQPDRPLEVHNLHPNWSVRIFDTGGLPVRKFTNGTGDTLDWSWDFTNNRGLRVARALYLVRVTDEGGSVVQSARFLVQQDR